MRRPEISWWDLWVCRRHCRTRAGVCVRRESRWTALSFTIEMSNVESLWTRFFHISPPRKQSAKRQLQTQKSRSIRQLQAPKLPSPHSTLKPQPHHPGRRGSGTRETATLSAYLSRRGMSILSGHASTSTCRRLATGTRFCISRFVLHICTSFLPVPPQYFRYLSPASLQD